MFTLRAQLARAAAPRGNKAADVASCDLNALSEAYWKRAFAAVTQAPPGSSGASSAISGSEAGCTSSLKHTNAQTVLRVPSVGPLRGAPALWAWSTMSGSPQLYRSCSSMVRAVRRPPFSPAVGMSQVQYTANLWAYRGHHRVAQP